MHPHGTSHSSLSLTAAIFLLLCAIPQAVGAASMEIWPSERRSNNTFFCYGNDWNSMLITIYQQDWGKHRLQMPEQFAEPTMLHVTLPDAVEFLGASVMGIPGVGRDFAAESVARDDKAYQKISIPLDNETLDRRLIKGKYYYHVFVWFGAPETLDDTVTWELTYGDQPMATGASRLLTAGVVRDGRKLPKRFGFYPYGTQTVVPNGNHDRVADFYRRFGISGMESHWTYGLPADEPTNQHLMFEANRRHGVKNIANMTLFAKKYGGKYGGTEETAMARGGLVAAMDESCAGLESDEALADWQAAHGFFDMTLWDWEPTGPRMWPGYEDKATIAAFARQRRIAEKLTPERIQADYREDYAKFRMEQVSRPLYSMRKTIDAVKPMLFRVEQGSGATRHIDYGIYGNDFEALTPMVYQPRPISYARNLLETLAGTNVPARKFWPDMTIGWSMASVHRESPEAFLMDTIVTAAAGCGSVSHWPGVHYSDASWFGIHEGLARIAMVEDFYLDGSGVDTIEMRGLAYREETVDLGHRTLVQSAPDWRATLLTFAHELDGEYALTLLNYHLSEDAFVRLSAPALSNLFLANPVEAVYQVLDDQGVGVVRVAKESPGLWIATKDKARIQGCRKIEAATVEAEFATARDAFLAANTKSEIALGTVQDITVAYGLTEFGGEERVTLDIRTPTQSISFGPSGGRVYDWAVEGMDKFVGRDGFGTDGMVMDMLWLPASARWSGDETQELTLVECTNDGREARVVYEGRLKTGFPGIRLRKTYRVPATGTSLSVDVSLRNERVDQTPAKLAYWSHSVLDCERTHFIGRELTHETGRGVTTILVADGLPQEMQPDVLMPDKVIGATGRAYAEYFPNSQSGLIFRLPASFMNVYRWSATGKPVCGSEWMSRPLSIPAGTSTALAFSITAVPEATSDSLRAALAEETTETGAGGSLLPYGFAKLGEDGLPSDWRIRATGENADAAKITTEQDETGAPVVRVEIPREASVYVDTAKRTRLDPDGDYMLVVQIRVEDLHYTGNWYKRPAGIRIYVYGTNDKHRWLAVHGDGSTDGWVTGVLPFPMPDEVRPQFASSNVLLRCYNMTGTVLLRNPMILRRPPGVDIQNSFELEDGTQVFGGQLQLRR